jgi:hypothetical protein
VVHRGAEKSWSRGAGLHELLLLWGMGVSPLFDTRRGITRSSRAGDETHDRRCAGA